MKGTNFKMKNFLESLSSSDLIQLSGIVVSVITSVIAIFISIATLLQNSKMVKESTRPYIMVYQNYCYCLTLTNYLVLKNFGQTGAEITKFSCTPSLDSASIDFGKTPFSHIKGTFLAPGQSIKATLDFSNTFPEIKWYFIEIEYVAGKNKYQDSFKINLESLNDTPVMRANTKGQELNTISFTLQDISEKML